MIDSGRRGELNYRSAARYRALCRNMTIFALRIRTRLSSYCGCLSWKVRVNRLQIIILAGVAGLDLFAGAFAWNGFAGERGRLVARPVPAIVPENQSEFVIPAQGDDREILARPLFSKSRRPTPPGQRQADGGNRVPSAPPAGIKLNAVILFNRAARAFMSSNASLEGKWFAVGETFENWTVDSIAPQEVALRRDASLIRIGLAYNGVSSPIISSSQSSSSADAEPVNHPWPSKIAMPPTFDDVRSWKREGH